MHNTEFPGHPISGGINEKKLFRYENIHLIMSYKKYIAMIEKKVKPEKNKGHQQKACEGFDFLAQFSKKIS